jgi:hypothetical protein
MTPENLGCQILADTRAISRLPNFTRMALGMRLKMRSILRTLSEKKMIILDLNKQDFPLQ